MNLDSRSRRWHDFRARTGRGLSDFGARGPPGGPSMPLDPQAEQLLKAMASQGLPPIESVSPPGLRAQMEAVRLARGGTGQPVRQGEDRKIPAPAGRIPLRI